MKERIFEIIISIVATIALLVSGSALVFWKDSAERFVSIDANQLALKTLIENEVRFIKFEMRQLNVKDNAIVALQKEGPRQWVRIAENHDDINQLRVKVGLPITGWKRTP